MKKRKAKDEKKGRTERDLVARGLEDSLVVLWRKQFQTGFQELEDFFALLDERSILQDSHREKCDEKVD